MNAFALGIAAIGAHRNTTNWGTLSIGQTYQFTRFSKIEFSSKAVLTDTVAGAGGLLAVNGGEAITNTITEQN